MLARKSVSYIFCIFVIASVSSSCDIGKIFDGEETGIYAAEKCYQTVSSNETDICVAFNTSTYHKDFCDDELSQSHLVVDTFGGRKAQVLVVSKHKDSRVPIATLYDLSVLHEETVHNSAPKSMGIHIDLQLDRYVDFRYSLFDEHAFILHVIGERSLISLSLDWRDAALNMKLFTPILLTTHIHDHSRNRKNFRSDPYSPYFFYTISGRGKTSLYKIPKGEFTLSMIKGYEGVLVQQFMGNRRLESISQMVAFMTEDDGKETKIHVVDLTKTNDSICVCSRPSAGETFSFFVLREREICGIFGRNSCSWQDINIRKNLKANMQQNQDFFFTIPVYILLGIIFFLVFVLLLTTYRLCRIHRKFDDEVEKECFLREQRGASTYSQRNVMQESLDVTVDRWVR